jgi:benzoyl-CoA reductase/2-hydroxyglutaryl-CoA dehydratase subunit BcrC/BadD/HgdB
MRQITLDEWEERYEALTAGGMKEPWYGGRLSRHLRNGDTRLAGLVFDGSMAALDLWNFLLSEDERLLKAKRDGKKLIGAMKDLGTVPVMVYAHPECIAFYPDGAWWIPCVMGPEAGLMEIADSLGVDDSFCPVRAMLGAFVTGAHFPIPDLLVSSVGATCDDFSAIAQVLAGLGHDIFWWEIPHRNGSATEDRIAFVRKELTRVKDAIGGLCETGFSDEMLEAGIVKANEIRACLEELRGLVFTARKAPLPALELLVAEMMAIHYCSDRDEALSVLKGLLETVKHRVSGGIGYFGPDAVRVFWVNPVADIRIMNVLEKCGGRVCGTEYLFTHALDIIPTDVPPMETLARMALADPMAGSAHDRAGRICKDIERYGSEAVLISRIPGASHCALESSIIEETVRSRFDIPVAEIEISSRSDSFQPAIETRLSALVETVRELKKRKTSCFTRASTPVRAR